VRITNIDWTDDSIFHIAKHNVSPEEVEEVCFFQTAYIEKGRQGLYYATGQTEAGRYLFVVVRFIGHGKVVIVTARDMDNKEKTRYKNKMR